MSAKGGGVLATWDFRYNADTFETHEEVIETLKGVAKKYVFQLEQGDNGYRHYQGRLSLIKKRRKAEKHLLLKLFKDKPPNYLEPTTNAEHLLGESFYVIKDDTRLEGPWRDTDPEPPIITKQLEGFMGKELYPYQKQLYHMTQEFDERKIDLLYDRNGNIGKSLFAEYCEYKGVAEEIPPFRMMDDIFQWVCTRPIKPCYIIDMPRGMKKDKLADLYSGIEVVKNGVAYDKRYHAKKIRFNRPRIFVFTNMLPCFDLMSKDRWNVWEINEKMELEPYIMVVMKSKQCNVYKPNVIIDGNESQDELEQVTN
jgi:hypothetical protein